MKYAYLAVAILLICMAHLLRTKRWRLFVEIYERPNEKILLRALSLGFFLNYFVPFKIGDIIRALYASRQMKHGKTLALSTVIVDRYLDIFCVGILSIVIVVGIGGSAVQTSALFYIGLMVVLLLCTGVIVVGRTYVKRFLVRCARIFNPDIEARLLKFAWSLITNFRDIFQRVRKSTLIVTTFGMWALYSLSYFFFAQYLSVGTNRYSYVDVFLLFFSKSSIERGSFGEGELLTVGYLLNNEIVGTAMYLVLPIVLLFILSFCNQKISIAKETDKEDQYINLLPQLNDDERRNFLELYFSDEKQDFVKNYLKINQDISIIRDFSAGSNATTMLCVDQQGTVFFRKYAFAEDGDKLYEQVQWIIEHQNTLPLPQILRYGKESDYCYYDMPYQSNTTGMFTYAHSMPVEQSWNLIRDVLEGLACSAYQCNVRDADKKIIRKYIRSKVSKNLDKICGSKCLKGLMNYDTIIINGVPYPNLSYYEGYLSESYLLDVLACDTYSDIHGDLTIENIICVRGNMDDDYYLIDPNTGNIHDSPNLDYGKLLQSLHGGYEFLMGTKSVSVADNRIDFTFTKSYVYTELHNRLRSYMVENFPPERVKSIYFHEIIHWLRLMPYKIERDSNRAPMFYAGLLMVLHDVITMYEENEHEAAPGTV